MQKRIPLNWKTISAVAAVMLLVVAFLSVAGGSVGAQDTPASRTISVSGSGEAYGAPDVAYVNLGIDVSDSDIGKALDSANQTMTGIIAAITDTGVDAKDIQTVNFSVYPEDKYDPQTGQPTGQRIFHVQNSVNVTVRDIAKVGAVMQAGLGAGANTINGLSFGISDTKSLEQQARLQAVDDARTRAQALADAFGVKLGDVVSIIEVNASAPIPVTYAKADAMAMGGGGVPQVNPGQLSVGVQLSVTFAIGG